MFPSVWTCRTSMSRAVVFPSWGGESFLFWSLESMTKFPLWRCFCLPEVLSDAARLFRSPSAASVSSHMAKTMSSPCSAHVDWLSSQLQNVLFHPSDTSGFIWRNLNSEPLWIFLSDVSWHGVVWSSWSHFCSWWLSEEPFHHWLWQWCFSRIMIYLHLLKGCSSSKEKDSK